MDKPCSRTNSSPQINDGIRLKRILFVTAINRKRIMSTNHETAERFGAIKTECSTKTKNGILIENVNHFLCGSFAVPLQDLLELQCFSHETVTKDAPIVHDDCVRAGDRLSSKQECLNCFLLRLVPMLVE